MNVECLHGGNEYQKKTSQELEWANAIVWSNPTTLQWEYILCVFVWDMTKSMLAFKRFLRIWKVFK